MSELLAEPGFEAGGTAWTLTDGAYVDASAARSGSLGAVLPYDPGQPPPDFVPATIGSAKQSVAVRVGEVHSIEAWVRLPSGPGLALLLFDGETIAELSAPESGDWYLLQGWVTPASTPLDMEIRGSGIGGAAIWHADDCSCNTAGEVAAMDKNPRRVWLAFAARLKTISKAGGYWHDAPQILPRGPLASVNQRGEWIGLPAEDFGPMLEHGPSVMEWEIHQPVYVMLADAHGSEFEGSVAADAWDWLADLVRAIAPSEDQAPWDLGDLAVSNVRVIEKAIQSEPMEGFPPLVRVVFGARVMFSRADLGPGA